MTFWPNAQQHCLQEPLCLNPAYLCRCPSACTSMTHAYFCFYHCLANVLLRRLSHALKKHGKQATRAGMALLVFGLSYATAFAETFTIASFPYYNFKVMGILM